MSDNKKKDVSRWFEIPYLLMNGFSVGNTINATWSMIEDGYSEERLGILALWLMSSVWTGVRWYQIKKQINDNNNQKTR